MPRAKKLILAVAVANVLKMALKLRMIQMKANALFPPGGEDLPCSDKIEQLKKVLRKQPISPMTTSFIPLISFKGPLISRACTIVSEVAMMRIVMVAWSGLMPSPFVPSHTIVTAVCRCQ